MFGMKPPLRFMVARLLADGRPRKAGDVLQDLKPLYGRERQFTLRAIEEHLQALKAVGVTEVQSLSLGQPEGVITSYRLSAHGRQLLERLNRS